MWNVELALLGSVDDLSKNAVANCAVEGEASRSHVCMQLCASKCTTQNGLVLGCIEAKFYKKICV